MTVHRSWSLPPEKLLYVLRHDPKLADHADLLVFDECHQFDNDDRGITYELLLASLRSRIPEKTQKVLMSAVISNAEDVGKWMNGNSNVVKGTDLIQTFRSTGRVIWPDPEKRGGSIQYYNEDTKQFDKFTVPEVVKKFKLGKRGNEQKERFFPEPGDSNDIALYLGIKLAPKGGIAIFCGQKNTATKICERASEVMDRGIPFPPPKEYSNPDEVKRLHHLHDANLGREASASKSAKHGIFAHHNNIPRGIRLSVEHAMRERLVRFVVCTSTLTQGVNLPIRYLVFPGIYQSGELIKVRDFHNLMGRAGRAGMYTEGSILFAMRDKHLDKVKTLLKSHAEPCISHLPSIFKLIYIGKTAMEGLDFASTYIEDPDVAKEKCKQLKVAKEKCKQLKEVDSRISLICAVESFLLSHGDESEDSLSEEAIIRLAEGTLAFFLADDDKKKQIQTLFKRLADNIRQRIPDPARRKIYGRTLYGIQDNQAIEAWVQEHADKLMAAKNSDQVLDHVWPLISKHVGREHKAFRKYDNDVLKEMTKAWISGDSFDKLLKIADDKKCKRGNKKIKIETMVDIFENGLAWYGDCLLSALCEFIEPRDQEGTQELIHRLKLFQKQMKYGLPNERTITLYEYGFSDRVIVQDLATSLNLVATQKKDLLKQLKKDPERINKVMDKYPAYFKERMKGVNHSV